MKKLFKVDLKRLLQNKAAILISVFAPLILVLLISLAVAPYFFSNVRAENFFVAVYNEDDDPLTKSILQGLIESESLGGLISVQFAPDEQEGLAALDDGAAAYIHIPAGMQDTLYHGGHTQITYVGNADMPLEDALLFETLNSGIELVSYAQHAVNVLYWDSRDYGIDNETAAAEYSATAKIFFLSVLARASLYEDTDLTSPLGSALPVEYYAVSFLILFVALGAMPIARITADDHATGLIHRQLLSGHTPRACFLSRWLAGAVFSFIQFFVLAVALGIIAGAAAKFQGNILILLLSGLLLCGFLSLGMLLVGLLSRSAPLAVRVAFMSALFLALMGGLIVPSAFLPQAIRDICYYSPFTAALRLGIAGLFDGEAQGVALYSLVLLGSIALPLPVSLKRFQRRSH
jgi:ABC-2 type transporter.